MIRSARYEFKIIGSTILWMSPLMLFTFLIVASNGGTRINWETLGFEILFPFFTTILTCEWVKTLSDPLIEVYVVHARSLFQWIIGRFFVVFGITSIFNTAFIAIWCLAISEASIVEHIIIYLCTAFFLSTLGLVFSFLSRQPHVSTAFSGVLWFLCLMIRTAFTERVEKVPLIGYFYPFYRFAIPEGTAWLGSKVLLLLLGLMLWIGIYLICYKRKLNL